jgi:small-conductance mechanosensitive channel
MQRIFDEQFLRPILLAVALTVLLLIVLWLIRFVWQLAYTRISAIEPKQETRKGFWRVFFARGRLAAISQIALRVLRFIATIVVIDIYLVFLFRLFPNASVFDTSISELTLRPLRIVRDALIAFIPDLLFILISIAITYAILKFFRVVFYEIAVGRIRVPGFYADWSVPTYKLVRFLVIAMMIVVIFPYLPGGRSPAAQGITIFLGVLISFGSSSAVSNVIAGVILTYTRAFRVGDYVKIGGTTGNVSEKNFLITRVRTVKNETVTIPNATVQNSEVVNYTRLADNSHLFLYTSVTIGYDTPWRAVHQLLLNAAANTENILAEPAPFVLQTALNDFYVSYQINAATKEPDLMVWTYSALHQNIQQQFNQAGLEIMSPHYTSLRDGNTTTVPAAHRGDDYRAPAFRVLSNQSLPPSEKK